jgi:hypothetical protein
MRKLRRSVSNPESNFTSQTEKKRKRRETMLEISDDDSPNLYDLVSLIRFLLSTSPFLRLKSTTLESVYITFNGFKRLLDINVGVIPYIGQVFYTGFLPFYSGERSLWTIC